MKKLFKLALVFGILFSLSSCSNEELAIDEVQQVEQSKFTSGREISKQELTRFVNEGVVNPLFLNETWAINKSCATEILDIQTWGLSTQVQIRHEGPVYIEFKLFHITDLSEEAHHFLGYANFSSCKTLNLGTGAGPVAGTYLAVAEIRDAPYTGNILDYSCVIITLT